MRWMMIALLVSVAALLITAVALARHIRVQHAKLRREPLSRVDAPEIDQEP